jgi:hypothetical protein
VARARSGGSLIPEDGVEGKGEVGGQKREEEKIR